MILDNTLRIYLEMISGTIGLLVGGIIGLLGGMVVAYFLTKTRKQ